MSYTSEQIRTLRSLAHELKPIVWVGQKGISDTLIENINEGLRVHELIKVKFHEKDEINDIIPQIVERTKATHVQTVGKIVTLFKRNKEKPKVKF